LIESAQWFDLAQAEEMLYFREEKEFLEEQENNLQKYINSIEQSKEND